MAIHYTKGEEWANAVSHGIGILIGIMGGGYLLHTALQSGDMWAVRGMFVSFFVRHACLVYHFHLVSFQPAGYPTQRSIAQIRPRRHLSAHCRQLFSYHAGQFARSRLLGMGNILFCVAVCTRRNHALLLQTEGTQLSGNNLLCSNGMQHLCCLQAFM